MRAILVAVLFLVSAAANAQVVTRNCVSATCTLVMDWTRGVAPNDGIATQCRLRQGTTVLETKAIGASGVGACTFTPRTFPAGQHTVTAVVLDSTGTESPSISLTFNSAVPLGPPTAPTNLRFQ
jgi:hypothetical protein